MLNKYEKKEIDELHTFDVEQRRVECDVMPISKLISLLEDGWIIYDTQVTSDKDLKILTLAKIS